MARGAPRIIETERMRLVPLTVPDAAAVSAGRRRPDWAADYPTDGDVVIARLLAEHPPGGVDEVEFGPRAVVETATGLVVGGVGFRGPPVDGAVEIGYGLAESRRGRGLATEAVAAMVAFAFDDPRVRQVCAETDPDNAASQRVLLRCGFAPAPGGGDRARFVRPRAPG